MHVDEDDGDVLVAGLAGIWFIGWRASVEIKLHKRRRRRDRGRSTYHLVNALPSLERLRTVASTRFLVRAALPVDLPPAMDGICRCCCCCLEIGGWREERSVAGKGNGMRLARSDPEGGRLIEEAAAAAANPNENSIRFWGGREDWGLRRGPTGARK